MASNSLHRKLKTQVNELVEMQGPSGRTKIPKNDQKRYEAKGYKLIKPKTSKAAKAEKPTNDDDGEGGEEVNMSKMKKADLVALADSKGLDTDGTVADLIERIEELDEE